MRTSMPYPQNTPVPGVNSVLLTVERLPFTRRRDQCSESARMIKLLISLVMLFFLSRAGLAAENLALRHQLIVLKRSVDRPRLRIRDRLY